MITAQTISAVLDGFPVQIARNHKQAPIILQALRDGRPNEEVLAMFRKATAAAAYLPKGTLTVEGDSVFYNGEELHGVVVDRILQFARDGLPTGPMVKFLENLMQNPSRRAREELYQFLEHLDLMIDEDGFVVGYKAVDSDYMDKHTHTCDNHPGNVLSMPRRDVDDDTERGCSYGFHMGSFTGYVKAYYYRPGDRVLLVRTNPADVVSIPKDLDYAKMRTCRYEVLSDVTDKVDLLPAEAVSPLYRGDVAQLTGDARRDAQALEDLELTGDEEIEIETVNGIITIRVTED